jgi:anti-sigma factor RsiW
MTNDPNHPRPEDLFAFRDGELPPERRALIEAHVSGCSTCRALIDQVSSLEAELRRSPDRSPAEYLEHLHESVRARIAVPGGEPADDVGVKAAHPAVVPAGRETGRRRGRRGALGVDQPGQAGEDGRVKDAPGLPWAAVLSTASAAAAVLVVAVILIKQGVYQRAIAPAPMKASEAPAEGVPAAPGESTAAVRSIAANARGVPAPGSTSGARTVEKLAGNLPGPEGAKEPRAKDQLAKREQKKGNEAADEAGKAVGEPRDERTMAQQAAPLAASAPESDRAATSRFRADEQLAAGSEFEAVLRRYGLPPVWDAQVAPETLERAEPELRTLYTSGRAGADSARVRLYLAEALRLRYTPGDSTLYEGIVHHYRRAMALGRTDPDAARVAEERLRSLER